MRPWHPLPVLFDPLGWAAVLALLAALGIDWSWMLLIVPLWVIIRVVLVWRKLRE